MFPSDCVGWHHHKGGGGNRGGFGDSGARPGVEIQGPLPSEGFNANGGSALPNLGFTGTGRKRVTERCTAC